MVVTITCNFIAAGKSKMGGRLLKNYPLALLSFPGPSVSMQDKTLLKENLGAKAGENLPAWVCP